jgi:hypothetical protein
MATTRYRKSVHLCTTFFIQNPLQYQTPRLFLKRFFLSGFRTMNMHAFPAYLCVLRISPILSIRNCTQYQSSRRRLKVTHTHTHTHTHIYIFIHIYIYIVYIFNSRNSCSVSLGCWVRQTRVLKHVWTCFSLRLHEPQTKWVVRSRAAEEVVHVRGIRLAKKWVTRIWSSG